MSDSAAQFEPVTMMWSGSATTSCSGLQIAKGRLDDAISNIVTAGEIDHGAEIGRAEGAAAIVLAGNAGRALDEDVRTLQVPGAGNPVCHAGDFRAAIGDEFFGALFSTKQFSENFNRSFAVLVGIDAEIEIDDLDASGGSLLFEAAFLGGFFCFQIEGNDIRRKGDRRFQAEVALRQITETRQFFDLRKTFHIGRVAVGVFLQKIITPADDVVESLVALERRDDVNLACLADEDTLGRQIQLDLASGDVGDLRCQSGHSEKRESQHRKMPESVEPHEKSSLSSKSK